MRIYNRIKILGIFFRQMAMLYIVYPLDFNHFNLIKTMVFHCRHLSKENNFKNWKIIMQIKLLIIFYWNITLCGFFNDKLCIILFVKILFIIFYKQ